ncbi:MAG TPA: hypothetical protein VM029_19520, partial [Opitutaceae bacterium]|nr:hypothetical protein [Opitutaceae bacterium]
MNPAPSDQVMLSTRNLSADGARVTPGADATVNRVTPGEAVAILRAFAALPTLDLVDVEAKIYLANHDRKIAVQNVRGRLFVSAVPESVS